MFKILKSLFLQDGSENVKRVCDVTEKSWLVFTETFFGQKT